MALEKIILFYGFTPVADPNAMRLWQRDLCEGLELRGRILISSHGINATLGGDIDALRTYVRKTREFPGLRDIDVKWSLGSAQDFPRLSVRVRDEIVSFGVPEELKVEPGAVIGGGEHLTPEQVHDLVAARGADVVFFDGRNAFEARIGRMKDAVVPDTHTTHDFVSELDSGRFDHLKDKAVVTYCTGGVRCEILTVLMRNRGFSEVYQMHGGIVRYAEQFGNDGLWEGSLYIFDRRMNQEFGDDTKVIGTCDLCGASTSTFINCNNLSCRHLILMCTACQQTPSSRDCSASHSQN